MREVKMPVDAVLGIIEAEIKKMTPEERAALVKNIARMKKLAKELTEEESIINYHAKHVGC